MAVPTGHRRRHHELQLFPVKEEGSLVVGKKARGLLWVVSPAVVELGSCWVNVPDVPLNILEARSVIECGGNEGRPHRVSREAVLEANALRVLPEDAVD